MSIYSVIFFFLPIFYTQNLFHCEGKLLINAGNKHKVLQDKKFYEQYNLYLFIKENSTENVHNIAL